MSIMDRATYLPSTEAKITQLPAAFIHAIKFARAHDLIVIIGYVEDEERIYLSTVEDEDDAEPTA
jgi:hypothetical protein